MTDLRELYQEMILDHGRRPRNFRAPEGATHTAKGHNPLCGDRLTVAARVDAGVVADVGFQGEGCAISTAAASTMTEAVMGKNREQIEAIFRSLHDAVTGKSDAEPATLGKLAVFTGVREFPMRVKCATLAWHTLRAALDGDEEATTE